MNFTWDISLGQLIPLVLIIVGLIAGWITIKLKTSDNEEKTKNLGTRVEAYGIALADLRLHVESTCVKKDDLERLDERMGRRFDTVEHTIRNMTTQIMGMLTRNDGGGRPRS